MEKIQVRRINFLPNLIKNTKQTKNKKTKNKLNKTKFTLINDTSFYCYFEKLFENLFINGSNQSDLLLCSLTLKEILSFV